jgi:glycosyltransferase involved in cell wall biosynthesis
VALHPADEAGPYPAEVRHRIRRDIPADYERVALGLNDRGVSVVSLQHDLVSWGGDDGAYVLDFVRALRIPSVVTLHNVLRNPTASQRQVMKGLVEATSAAVVMSRAAASSLSEAYGVASTRAEFVPHGVPDLPLVSADAVKQRLGLAGQTVILSFGLLDAEKGYDRAIAAMPAVIKADPSVCYVILGATHPGCRSEESEAYRASLQAQAASLGVAGNIKFVDRFVGRVELATWLEAADLVLAPCTNLERTVSGALAYAMAAGRPIVSTPFAYASEMLGDGRGSLVTAESPAALAEAVISLLTDAEMRASMGRRAHQHSRAMVWWKVGHQYRRIFDRVAQAAAGRTAKPERPLASVIA